MRGGAAAATGARRVPPAAEHETLVWVKIQETRINTHTCVFSLMGKQFEAQFVRVYSLSLNPVGEGVAFVLSELIPSGQVRPGCSGADSPGNRAML